ncbi:MAG: hypothetical protein M3472_05050 [Chloroflexota bacterium]|nr:hypothetical protein [Chloroflexota bacterium]
MSSSRVMRTALLALLLLGCGEPEPTGITRPTAAGELVVRVETVGGLLPPLETERRLPSISIYGDGLAIVPGAVPDTLPGPAGYPLEAFRIDAELLDEIVGSALAIGLRGPDRRIEQEGPEFVVDGGATAITVVASGVRHVTMADALFDAPASSRERELLSGFVTRLLELRSTALDVAPHESTSAAVYIASTDPGFGPDQGSQPDAQWPFEQRMSTWGDPLPPSGLSVDVRCAVVKGAELTAALPALLGATATTPFVDESGDRRIVAWRAVLPDETGC